MFLVSVFTLVYIISIIRSYLEAVLENKKTHSSLRPTGLSLFKFKASLISPPVVFVLLLPTLLFLKLGLEIFVPIPADCGP